MMALDLGWLRCFGDLVFPDGCPGCDAALTGEHAGWCPDCLESLLAATGVPYCPRCGLTVGPHLVDRGGCAACRRHRTPLAGIVRVGHYGSLVGDLVKRFKYGRRQRLDRALGRLLAQAITGRSWAGELDAIVPVPASWRSSVRYRCRPVSLLSAAAGRELELPVLEVMFVRGKNRRQVDLDGADRARNVRGKFHLERGAHVEGATLCVVDDVGTTGATLREVGSVLIRAGAKRVYAGVLGKSDPKEAKALGA